ncbi:MAG: GNAT family N-acetyltransferase [Sphingobacterium sp.]|nr:GNAT family N-acetyltransferase [Sphingobacterium sp.]
MPEHPIRPALPPRPGHRRCCARWKHRRFCTIYYDDYTRSAVTVLVGVAAEHWRRGLGKAVVIEGMRRLKHLGCTRVFSTANEEPADALYNSVMTDMKVTDTWVKEWKE